MSAPAPAPVPPPPPPLPPPPPVPPAPPLQLQAPSPPSIFISAPYPPPPPQPYVLPAPSQTYPVALGPPATCPSLCNTVCMGSCPVACCTRFAPLPATRVYVPPLPPHPQPYYVQPPPPPYFQPQQQPWPTACPTMCRSKCVSTCPIHCCQRSVLDNLRRLANSREQHKNVAKSLTPATPGSTPQDRLHQSADQRESTSAPQPPPISLSPLLSSSIKCPDICSRHCTRVCSRECCAEKDKDLTSTSADDKGHVRRNKILHKRKPTKRLVANKRKL